MEPKLGNVLGAQLPWLGGWGAGEADDDMDADDMISCALVVIVVVVVVPKRGRLVGG